jgi:hypothetical protein
MFNQIEKCKKCGKMIIKSNHLLHESTCKGQSGNLFQGNSQDNLNSDMINNFGNRQQNEEFYHCTKCDMYFDILEKSDHILSHQFENEIVESGHENNGLSEPYYSRNPYNQPSHNFNFNSSTNVNINNNDTRQCGRIVSEQVSIRNGNTTIKRVIQNPDGSLTETVSTSSTGNNNNINNNFIQDENFFNPNPFVPMYMPGMRRRVSGGNPFSSNFIFSQPSNLEAFLQSMLSGLNPDHPVEDDILSSLPEIELEDLSKLPPEKKDCVVCLNKYETKEKVLILPCTHMFHTNCIKDWFKSQNTCPICKFKLDRSSMGSG